mmetsp:Transcript_24789/g.58166  ORF Transcript_24789/g.58166 Transcript_24789/m.58166 type:complete len:277 (-) Transcript_24789:273-1103(-)|eukprot:CAMPEP_0197186696 /NCGR_PEP_ID=MMETSP1423-20130617/14414_1 /TAXON_ID=476441 /ORGANISM="Pseudo-nitzschia heimii, Strain UNC1101" /LENGTH=276 /DNA_ID=CAMNT_0042638083 /DNA_START=89 /DNA_END=919 /DNA_ORIENTATION=-
MRSIQNKQQQMRRREARTSSSYSFLFPLVLVGILPHESHAFRSLASMTTRSASMRDTPLHAVPVDISAVATTAQHVLDPSISSLTAVLTSTIVAPSADALTHLQGAATATATALPVVKAAATTTTATIQEMLPGAGDAIRAQAQDALGSGWKVMDAAKFVHGGQASMPGFSETQSIVAPHLLPGPSDEAVTMAEWPQNMFKARMEYAGTMLGAIQKLPYVAFAYALLEFFFLRSDVDIYKEDVEDDPSGVLVESVSDATVRSAIFFGLALVTYVIS